MDSNPSSQPQSLPSYTSLKDTINNLPRTPQISRKVRACSACKKQKIRCDFDGEGIGELAKCVRCRKMKLECIVNRSLQTILDEDVEWKHKMAEDVAQLQRAVEDILTASKMRPLSAYTSYSYSAGSASCSPSIQMNSISKDSPESVTTTNHQASLIKEEDGSVKGSPVAAQVSSTVTSMTASGRSPERSGSAPRMVLPMTRENSPEPPQENHPRSGNVNGTSAGRVTSPYYEQYHISNALSTNPMGSLYEVTKLRSLRSNSTTNIHAHPHSHLGGDGAFGRLAGTRSSLRMSLCVENNDDDLISRGAIGLQEAEELFYLFKNTLNHYLFDVALVHDDLTSVRNSSSLLLAAILTVSLLHRPSAKTNIVPPRPGINSGSGTFQSCYQHFLTLVSSSMFDFPGGGGPYLHPTSQAKMQPPHTRALDNVRALCIAAFWLPDLSWKLSGHAVRIATELNVHQSFRKALAPLPNDPKLTENDKPRLEEERRYHHEKARLWYLLFVCDHHFSIAYGRPPVICHSQHEAIRDEGYERYLKSDLCKEGDLRVVSQLALFVVLERIYETFAGDISEGGLVSEEVLFGRENIFDSDNGEEENEGPEVSSGGSPGRPGGRKRKNPEDQKQTKKRKVTKGKVDQFNEDLDRWKNIWRNRHRVNASVGNYPAKAIDLHYHFAKLQLNSLALRGVTSNAAESIIFSPRRAAMARLAIESAKHVLETVLRVPEIRESLIGVPLYVHTVISFAAVFLMKIVSKWRKVASIGDLVSPVGPIWKLVEDVTEALRDAATGKINHDRKKANGRVRAGAGEMHIVWFIASGLEKMVKRCKAAVLMQEEEADAMMRAKESQHNPPADAVEKNSKGSWEDVWQHPKVEVSRPNQPEETLCPAQKPSVDCSTGKTSPLDYELGKKVASDSKHDGAYSSANHLHPPQEQQFYSNQQHPQQAHNFGLQHVSDHDMYVNQSEDPMNVYNLPYYNLTSYDLFSDDGSIGAGIGNVNGYFSAGLTSFDLLGAGAVDGSGFGEPLGLAMGGGAYYHHHSPEDHHHNHNFQPQEAQAHHGSHH